MVIELTERCDMGCTHCMQDCTMTGNDITLDVLKDSLEFARRYNENFIILSGGEPFLHPQIMEILEIVSEYASQPGVPMTVVTVTTNGEWLLNNKSKAKKIFNRFSKILFQITNDSRYYPRFVNTKDPLFRKSNVFTETHIRHCYPQGRALRSGVDCHGYKASKCTNAKLTTMQLNVRGQLSISNIINRLHEGGLMCSFEVLVNGDIVIGESRFCKPIGTIWDTEEDLLNSIINFDCEGCRGIMESTGRVFLTKEMLSIMEDMMKSNLNGDQTNFEGDVMNVIPLEK